MQYVKKMKFGFQITSMVKGL